MEINKKTINEKIDLYNKLRLLYNILNNFISQTLSTSSDEKAKIIVENFKSNLSRFIISKQINDENFGILYTNISTIKDQNSVITINEKDKLQLLSYFEEEIRQFIKKNDILFEYNGNLTKNEENENLLFNSKIKEISNLLNDNIILFNSIIETFQKNQRETKQELINEVDKDYQKINEILQKIQKYIFLILSNEQNFKSLEQIKINLLEKKKKTKSEIELIKSQIQNYINQGEDYMKMVSEYKRLCNMIDCMK